MGNAKFFGSVAGTLVTKLPLMRKAQRLSQEGRLGEVDRMMGRFVDAACPKFYKSAGLTLDVEGLELIPRDKVCVFVANHQSMFDALVMLDLAKGNWPCGFIMKKEHEQIPLVKQWCSLIHCVFVDRENPRAAVKALKACAENLDKGISMVVFPEGTRTKQYPKLGEFKNGAFKIAQGGKYPIVPVVIYDAGEHFEQSRKVKGGTIHVKVLPPVTLPAGDRKAYKLAAADLQQVYEQELAAFHGSAYERA